jgi:AraC-like DNA-binding protein
MPAPRLRDYQQVLLQLASDRPAASILLARANRGHDRKAPSPRCAPLYYHIAATLELALVTNGSARIGTPAEVFQLTPGKVLIIERGVLHAQLPGVAAPRHRVIWVHLSQTTASLVDSVYTSPSRGGFTYQLVELLGQTNVENVGNAIVEEISEQRWGYLGAVAGLLKYLAHVLARRVSHLQVSDRTDLDLPKPRWDERTWKTLEAALQFCDANYRYGITCEEVAKAVGYSPRHLAELMSDHLGHSLFAHVQNLRMLDARRLLEESSLSIRDIAAAVGYGDAAHFTRAFRRATGISPRVYRSRLTRI